MERELGFPLNESFETALARAVDSGAIEIIIREPWIPEEIVIALKEINSEKDVYSMVHVLPPINSRGDNYDLVAIAKADNHIDLTLELERLHLIKPNNEPECGNIFTRDGETIRGSFLYGDPCSTADRLVLDALDRIKHEEILRSEIARRKARGETHDERIDDFYKKRGI